MYPKGTGGGQFAPAGSGDGGGGGTTSEGRSAAGEHKPAPTEHRVPLPPKRPGPGVIDHVSVVQVSQMFPGTRVSNIKANLPRVLDALRAEGLVDKPMVLMALATIRAESAGFVPISEKESQYNTSPGGHPFRPWRLPCHQP